MASQNDLDDVLRNFQRRLSALFGRGGGGTGGGGGQGSASFSKGFGESEAQTSYTAGNKRRVALSENLCMLVLVKTRHD